MAVFVTAFVGCGHPTNTEPEPVKSEDIGINNVEMVEIDGHEYLILTRYRAGGICHSESCPCKEL